MTDALERPPAVVLVGARGHGRWHLENLRRLEGEGQIRVVGICDRARLAADELTGFEKVRVDEDLDRLLEVSRPQVTVICTPIHTHAELAGRAMRAGSHVLLEKPPAPTWEDYSALVRTSSETGRLCQVGFQDLGSTAIPEIWRLLEAGAIGELVGIGAACAWVRPRSYFSRSPWSGRRQIDGLPVVDGALTNPFAHATASALRLAHGERSKDIVALEVELYRANDIDSDDTSCLRVRTADGLTILVAATLCASENHPPRLVLHGTQGRITLFYKTGEVRLESDGVTSSRTYPRLDLLENLLAIAAGAEAPLLAPIAGMEGFMHVVEAVRTAPDPVHVDGQVSVTGTEEHVVIPGIDQDVTTASESLSLFSELGAAWVPAARPGVLSVEDGR